MMHVVRRKPFSEGKIPCSVAPSLLLLGPSAPAVHGAPERAPARASLPPPTILPAARRMQPLVLVRARLRLAA